MSLPFSQRLALAWRVLTDAVFAGRAAGAGDAAEPPPPPPPPKLAEAEPDAALQLLGLLQHEGRLIDFLREDVSAFSDAEIGNAARVVHQGCLRVLEQYFELEPVSEREEGSRVTLEPGFDASRYRLSGNVSGEPPFSGELVHRGWRATRVDLPRLAPGHRLEVVAPAEVEL